jgi:pimeloyl-ACP methyl ester carboxylesterase
LARLGRPRRRTVGLALLAIVLVVVGGFAWFVQPQPLLPEATASLESTPDVTFTKTDAGLEWAPTGTTPTTGLVFYPGGKVPPEAYGPAAQAIAAQGYLVVIPPMPFNLAVFDIDAGDRVRAAHPEIEAWAIAGHSLGGSMAAQHVANRPDAYAGLAFWAAYAATDLSGLDLAATSIYGTLDAGAPRMSGAEARSALPADAVFVPIEGGNHEQMGWYTGQPNDPPATISREDQQAQVVAATVTMLDGLSGGP